MKIFLIYTLISDNNMAHGLQIRASEELAHGLQIRASEELAHGLQIRASDASGDLFINSPFEGGKGDVITDFDIIFIIPFQSLFVLYRRPEIRDAWLIVYLAGRILNKWECPICRMYPSNISIALRSRENVLRKW